MRFTSRKKGTFIILVFIAQLMVSLYIPTTTVRADSVAITAPPSNIIYMNPNILALTPAYVVINNHQYPISNYQLPISSVHPTGTGNIYFNTGQAFYIDPTIERTINANLPDSVSSTQATDGSNDTIYLFHHIYPFVIDTQIFTAYSVDDVVPNHNAVGGFGTGDQDRGKVCVMRLYEGIRTTGGLVNYNTLHIAKVQTNGFSYGLSGYDADLPIAPSLTASAVWYPDSAQTLTDTWSDDNAGKSREHGDDGMPNFATETAYHTVTASIRYQCIGDPSETNIMTLNADNQYTTVKNYVNNIANIGDFQMAWTLNIQPNIGITNPFIKLNADGSLNLTTDKTWFHISKATFTDGGHGTMLGTNGQLPVPTFIQNPTVSAPTVTQSISQSTSDLIVPPTQTSLSGTGTTNTVTFNTATNPIIATDPVPKATITPTARYGGTPPVVVDGKGTPIAQINSATSVGSNISTYTITEGGYSLPPIVNVYTRTIDIEYKDFLHDVVATTASDANFQPRDIPNHNAKIVLAGIGVQNQYAQQRIEVDMDLYSQYTLHTYNNQANLSGLPPPVDYNVIPTYDLRDSTTQYTQSSDLGFNLGNWLNGILGLPNVSAFGGIIADILYIALIGVGIYAVVYFGRKLGGNKSQPPNYAQMGFAPMGATQFVQVAPKPSKKFMSNADQLGQTAFAGAQSQTDINSVLQSLKNAGFNIQPPTTPPPATTVSDDVLIQMLKSKGYKIEPQTTPEDEKLIEMLKSKGFKIEKS